MILILDTGIVGLLCHPRAKQSRAISAWLSGWLAARVPDFVAYVPEIADYELRRKLLHMIRKKQSAPRSVERLNDLGRVIGYLPITTEAMRLAAELWSDARAKGWPTADEAALDADVILAAQAIVAGGTVVTTNPKHLSRYVATADWTKLPPPAPRRKGRS
ncbi:MAG TPA: PIN domain-containing protein [Gemmataceae bacterium]|jgi:predicted nucleic acid-binding protein|nr:PIN domain-containing protein [Gemmataceae bacterium]